MEESNRQSAPEEHSGLLSPLGHSFLKRDWIFISIILVISLLLRITNLNESLWYDELFSTKMGLANISRFLETLQGTPHPPFYYFFMFLWIKIFGDSAISVRIPPLLFGIGSILLIYLIALKFTEKKTAFITSLLLCFSPVHIWYSHEARHYMGILFFLLLAIYSFYKIRESEAGSGWYYVYFGALFAAVFSHYYVIAILACISVICLFKIRTSKWAQKILVLNSIIFICFCLFFALKIMLGKSLTYLPHVGKIQTGLPHLRSFTPFELWKLFFNWFLFGNALWSENISGSLETISMIKANVIWKTPFILSTNIFFFVLFVRGLILLVKESGSSFGKDIILFLFAIPLFLMGLTLIGFKHIYIERSLLLLLPFFFVILAKGTRFKKKSVEILCTSLVLLFIFAALVGFFKKSGDWTVYRPKADWRSAAHFLDGERIKSEEPLLIFIHQPSHVLFYYLKRKNIDPYQIRFSYYDTRNFYYVLEDSQAKSFYCIKNNFLETFIRGPVVDEVLAMIKQDYRFLLVDKKIYKGIEVYKFDFVGIN